MDSSQRLAVTMPSDSGGSTGPDRAAAEIDRYESVTAPDGAGPAAAFCNPFRGGSPEVLLLSRRSGNITQLMHLSPRDGGRRPWICQVVMDLPAMPAELVTTSYQGTVQAYWTGRHGRLWRSLLTPDGFSTPVALRWALDTQALQTTYFLPQNGGPAEPVLYGITPGRTHSGVRLWIRTLHGHTGHFDLPDLAPGNRLQLSMTGRTSWVIDTAQNGFLRRWDGHVDGSVNEAVTYAMAGVQAMFVFGTCDPVRLQFPQPMFVANDGLAYLWNPRMGPLPCTTARMRVAQAVAARGVGGDSVVYLSGLDGRLSVARQFSWEDLDPHWGGSRVITRDLGQRSYRLASIDHPVQPAAVFAVGLDDVTRFMPRASTRQKSPSVFWAPWDRAETPLSEVDFAGHGPSAAA
ncbi:hypothetical protein [Streptomyces vinaceus]|uniref:hypothetical protein n=1 Tax=Streptomyces vinaceus TaxID=1960 RepID=UPI0036A8838E